jgi:hypothetical protein
MTTNDNETPRTDICESCDREIVPELVKVTGQHELIHEARKQEEGFMPVTGGKATVSFSCRCSNVRVEYGPGSASAWDIPDSWMWEDEFPKLFDETGADTDRGEVSAE